MLGILFYNNQFMFGQENSHNPTYNQIINMVRPFFMSRGGDAFATNERMLLYTNLAIQDVFATDDPVVMYESETIDTFTEDGEFHRFKTKYPIYKVQALKSGDCQCSGEDMIPELYFIDCDNKFKFRGKQILTNKRHTKIHVVYVRDYEWITDTQKLNEEIPLPARYIPALIKLIYDWASPINLTESEGATIDFFSHGITRLNNLSNKDGLTDVYHLKTHM
jgi:hypothetical protein|nr:MAG TPA: hypothetical protein [Bacteriophage sp.]